MLLPPFFYGGPERWTTEPILSPLSRTSILKTANERPRLAPLVPPADKEMSQELAREADRLSKCAEHGKNIHSS